MQMEHVSKGLGGIAIAAGAARALMTPFALIWGVNSAPELWAGLVACWLMALGTAGLFLGQLPRVGVWGFIGFALVSLSNMITACFVWSTMIEAEPVESFLRTVNEIAMLAGTILFAAASWRAGVLPRWGIALFLAWPLIGFLPYMGDWMALFWGFAYVALGYPIVFGKTAKRN
ncbi:MAG: hypothetical protein K0R28_439 [Paenibacillus sp.]|jgi:hypothetical protein|nr:hypothetical protein [Paenibacillus sp.]